MSASTISTNPAPQRRDNWLGFVLIFFAALGLYLPSLTNGFVWDDVALVQRDPLIRSWQLGSEAFDHFLFLDATGSDFYRPIQRLTYIFDYHFYFFNPWGYHLSSIVVHALAAGAFFLLARAVVTRFSPDGTASFWPALAASLIWAVHPLHTSAVTYVSGRADPLAALFIFLGLAVALRAMRNPLVNWRDFVAGLCFLLAAFSKELGLISFGLWLVTLLWARASTHRIVAALAISACAMGVYAFMRTKAERLEPPPAIPSAISERPALALAALGEYAELALYPRTLRMERGQQRWVKSEKAAHATIFQTPPAGRIATGCLIAALLAFWMFHAVRSGHRAQALALSLAAATYLPVSNLLSLNATVAEHWLYLPLAFLLLAASLELTAWVRRWRVDRPALAKLTIAGVMLWTLALAVRTWTREHDWRDQQTFLDRTIADGGATTRMYINRAQQAILRDDRAAARADFERADALSPDQPFALLGLAALDYAESNYEAARTRVLKIREPFFRPAALEMLALIARAEKSGDGITEMNRALSLHPDDWPLTRRKVKFLIADGKNGEATVALRDFVLEHPFRAEAWLLFSECLLKDGSVKGSEKAAQWATRQDVHLDRQPK